MSVQRDRNRAQWLTSQLTGTPRSLARRTSSTDPSVCMCTMWSLVPVASAICRITAVAASQMRPLWVASVWA